MGIRTALHHKTTYEYDRLVSLSPQTIRLRPAPHCRTPIGSYSLRIEPREHFINWQQDPHGNFVARVVFPRETRELSVEVDLVTEMTVINPFDFFLEPYAEKYPFKYESREQRHLAPFLEAAAAGPLLRRLIDSIDTKEARTVDFLSGINQRLQREIRYMVRMEPGIQTPEQTLGLASGSCRDTGWLLVQLLRHLGLAARFVSGYLIQLTPDVKPLEGPVGPASDFTDLHAWTEAYLPGAGWVGLDPTSGLFAGEGHIPLAATTEPDSAAPISGLVSPCEVEFRHEMTVQRIAEDPRVTKPYTEEQWASIDALGRQVDAELRDGDVRLTMGGEPTFVSADDMDGEEWNTAATGPNKRRIAAQLLPRLREKFAPGGFMHYGQGKWYPGETLPRWAYTCYWRTDGVPVWSDPQWSADPERDYGFDAATARAFSNALAETLEVGARYVIPAYEDPFAYILKERQLPVNLDPLDNRLDDPEERRRVRRIFERGLGQPAGFVLPLHRGTGKNGKEWQSGLWMLRSQHLYLTPGDSPIGLRLPLSELPWEPPEDRLTYDPVDPMAPAKPLPIPRRQLEEPRKTERTTARPGVVVRTALAVEPRQGRLHVFLPPVPSAEDYVDLVAAVEDTAARTKIPVLVEGYPFPRDPRVRELKITPDPGVIEINIHPAGSWDELVGNTTTLYEEARGARLASEKFMLDGRHTGTGGGNHIVLGGATPADSPFLRRPDMLKSMIGYWLNHPSLSYLFSGLFIGPTSQAPRVDETRADSIYELGIAFDRIRSGGVDENGRPYAPWIVDRIFRNLLVDVTGNTHRAEFCIDKLYSPDSSTGRLGLVELRAFEMPPHSRMSLAQQLLVRSLVAWFWRRPYEQPPVRWGTRLHDAFMLPFFVEQDFRRVIADLQDAGYPFDLSWFAPHLEFRFPPYGRAEYDGIEIELRQAIEPWYVLGEEPAGGGTTRFVDSSMERLQVRVKSFFSEAFAVTCNGRRLPLHSTGTQGDWVCGVRYRAWQPPRCLHPTIPVHTPLVFDLIDIAAGRSIGGCTYHVAHPGGRNYETFAVNSNEAESRRMARFSIFGHTPGPVTVPPVAINPEFPATLDLRTYPVS